jgi:hypothetical protein
MARQPMSHLWTADRGLGQSPRQVPGELTNVSPTRDQMRTISQVAAATVVAMRTAVVAALRIDGRQPPIRFTAM